MLRTSLAAFTERLAATIGDRGELPPLNAGRIRIELLAGLTVALALVPEAVAFAGPGYLDTGNAVPRGPAPYSLLSRRFAIAEDRSRFVKVYEAAFFERGFGN